jgi:hypothetical protein
MFGKSGHSSGHLTSVTHLLALFRTFAIDAH